MTDIPKSESPRTVPAWLAVGAPLAVMVTIFYLSSRPHLPDLDGSRDLQSIVGHFTAYAALGAALSGLLRWMGWGATRALLVAIVLATLYGVTDELHQSFVPNRTPDSKDLLVDFLGATAGALVAMRFLDWRNDSASATSDADRDQPAGGSS